jgi:hypothetical protein
VGRVSFRKWPREEHARWIMAGNTFGRHLMAASREYALERIPKLATSKERELAEKAVLDAIYGVMMLLDGVSDSRIDKDHVAAYVLLSRIFASGQSEPVEQFELAPDGDGLCMGFHGWVADDFGNA